MDALGYGNAISAGTLEEQHRVKFHSAFNWNDDERYMEIDEKDAYKQPLSNLPDLSALLKAQRKGIKGSATDDIDRMEIDTDNNNDNGQSSKEPVELLFSKNRKGGVGQWNENVAVMYAAMSGKGDAFKEIIANAATIPESLISNDVAAEEIKISDVPKKTNVPLKLVSEFTDKNHRSGISAFSMAACGGPVGALIRFMPQDATMTLVGYPPGNDILLYDPHGDPRRAKAMEEALKQGKFAMTPLTGHPSVMENGHNMLSLSEYFSEHYLSNNTSCETRIYVLKPPTAEGVDEKGKEEANDRLTAVGNQSPGVLPIGRLSIDAIVIDEPNPIASVQFQPEETEEGKRKRPQPFVESIVRVESEESEEKKARTPPAATVSIPSASVDVTKPKRKSVATSAAVTPAPTVAPKANVAAKPKAAATTPVVQEKK